MVCPSEGCYAGLTPEELSTIEKMRVGNYVASRKAKALLNRFSKPNQHIICVSALRKLCEDAGLQFDDERDNKSQYSPHKQFQALAKYHGRSEDIDQSDPAWVEAVAKTYSAFAYRPQRHRRQLEMLPLDERIESALKTTTSSGLPCMVRKVDCFQADLDRARDIVAGKRKPQPCFAFARIQHGEAGPKQRLVWGFPQSTTIIEATLARPLIDLFLQLKTPMVVGYRRFELTAMAGRIKTRKWQYGLDFSAFDSTVSRLLIGVAFNIMKTWFVSSDEVNKRFNLCEWLFTDTRILMPDGLVYAKKRGIPSGSYFTQLVGSIVNYLCLQYGMIKLTGTAIGRDDVMVLGDDSIIGLGQRIDVLKLKAILSVAGLKVNDLKTHVTRRGQHFHFLGHTWVHGVVDRPLVEVGKRLVYPERSDESTGTPAEKVRRRILQYYADSRSMHKLLAKANYFQAPDSGTWFYANVDDLVETGWRKYLSTLINTNHVVSDFPTMGILY